MNLPFMQLPPEPPPKPLSHDFEGRGTLNAAGLSPTAESSSYGWKDSNMPGIGDVRETQEPGERWLPESLRHKLQQLSTQEILNILKNPATLDAFTFAPNTIHSSLRTQLDLLMAMVRQNTEAALSLSDLETRVKLQRATVRAQMLATHALERQWRQKQAEMDVALEPFSPASLYQKLTHGVQDQAHIWRVLEDSFLDSGGTDGAPATERETLEWLRRYKEAKTLAYMRQERKNRWDEGRVGGWR